MSKKNLIQQNEVKILISINAIHYKEHFIKRFTTKRIALIVNNNIDKIKDILKAYNNIVDTKCFEKILSRISKTEALDDNETYDALKTDDYKQEFKIITQQAKTVAKTDASYNDDDIRKLINKSREVALKTDTQIKDKLLELNICNKDDFKRFFKVVEKVEKVENLFD